MRAGLAILLLFATTSVSATPMCRDLKGLMTPCAPDAIARMKSDHVYYVERRAKAVATRKAEGKPPRAELFAIGHMCRDSKGVFKPCGR